ncbi:MAG: hypothetical protein JSR47_14580 [Proteobacteria bacterium]|nr:hypothetical protein [Pseudomonadota bacterium]MBS0547059.1 hypothetical protein [Pseudomonadota bacterium]
MISPLSLSNLLTVCVAFACLWSIVPQARGGIVRIWRLAIPAALAAVQAFVLLAGVFEASIYHDLQWLVAALIGGVLGRMRGWSVSIEADRARDLVRLKPSMDAHIAAMCLAVLAAVDLISAALEDAVLPANWVAAASAFFAAYIGLRALAIAVRATRGPHGTSDGGWGITPSSSTPVE